MAFTVASGGGEVLVVIAPLIATALWPRRRQRRAADRHRGAGPARRGRDQCGERHADGADQQPVGALRGDRDGRPGRVLLVAVLLHPVHGVDFLSNTGDTGGHPAWYGAALAMLIGVFTITGFETCAGLGEEGVNVRFNIPRGVIGSAGHLGRAGHDHAGDGGARHPRPPEGGRRPGADRLHRRLLAGPRRVPALPGRRRVLGLRADRGLDRVDRPHDLRVSPGTTSCPLRLARPRQPAIAGRRCRPSS